MAGLEGPAFLLVGVLLGLGTMLGRLMAESGGADRIARTPVDASARSACTGR